MISENRLVLRADQLRAIEYHYKSAYNTVPMCMKMFSFGMDWAYASKGLCCSRSPQEVLSVLILAGISITWSPLMSAGEHGLVHLSAVRDCHTSTQSFVALHPFNMVRIYYKDSVDEIGCCEHGSDTN